MMSIRSSTCFKAGFTLFLSIAVIALGTVGAVVGLLVGAAVLLRLLVNLALSEIVIDSTHNVPIIKHNTKMTNPVLEFIYIEINIYTIFPIGKHF